MLKAAAIAVALSGAASLGGCVDFKTNGPAIVVNVKSEGDECRVTVTRNPYVQPLSFIRVTQAQLLQVGRETRSRRAIVVADVNAQYKCMGAAIITLQEAGLLVDFAPWESR
jgi:hypothetical protein